MNNTYKKLLDEGLINAEFISEEDFTDFMDEMHDMIEDGSGLCEVEDLCLDMGMDLGVIERVLLG